MRRSKTGFTLIELLVVIAIIAILAAILFPVFAAAREKSRQATCLSNEKQQAIACLAYINDWDETFPMNLFVGNAPGTTTKCSFSYYQALTPYEKSAGIWICPDAQHLFVVSDWNSLLVPLAVALGIQASDGIYNMCVVEPLPTVISYAFNFTVIDDGTPPNRPSKKLSAIPYPDQTGLMYDGAITLDSAGAPAIPGAWGGSNNGTTAPPSDYSCNALDSPVNPIHAGGAVINLSFVDGHCHDVHVKPDMTAAGNAAATCLGLDLQVVPVGVVNDPTVAYNGSQEIWGTPNGQNTNGTWNWAGPDTP
jgi:prepilin-type N-terminal cleavage/methylation domain-containing protein/prepilin-type processing-associated H-X9-DG protein